MVWVDFVIVVQLVGVDVLRKLVIAVVQLTDISVRIQKWWAEFVILTIVYW